MLPSNSLFRYQHSDSEENERSIALTCVSSWVSRSELTLMLLCCFITPRSLSLLTYTPFSTWWSQPSTTVPKTTCRPSRWEVLLVHCDPLGIFPRIRHANYSRSSVCFNWKFSSFKFCTVYRHNPPVPLWFVKSHPWIINLGITRERARTCICQYQLGLVVTVSCNIAMLPLTEGLKVLDPSWGQHSPRACQYDDPSSWVVCQLTRQKTWWLLLWNNCVNVVGNVFTGHVAFRQVEDQEPHFLFHPLPL